MSDPAALADVQIPAADAAAAAIDPARVIELARELIAARSQNPGDGEDAAAEVASRFLAELDAQPRVVRSDAGRPSVIATIGGGGPSLAWNGHIDTVPAGSPDTWSHPPFAGVIDDGRLIGRGAVDMKGALASALVAAEALLATGTPLAGSLTFHLAADEELAGTHGTQVLRDHGLLTQDACIVGEPTDLRIGLAERGGCWITATAYGVAAHGSQPGRGVNAITSMSRFLLRLDEALPETAHPLCGPPTVNAALITGGSAPNMVPDRCVVDIDRRIVPGETSPDAVLEPFRAVAEDLRTADPSVRIDLEVREWTEAAEAPADSRVADLARAAIEAETGTAGLDDGFTGITDARFYINDASIPTIIFGPGSLGVAHAADEWVAVDDLATAARAYARIFAAWCAG